jgi:hypothetical protein
MDLTSIRFGIIAGLLLMFGFVALLLPASSHAERSILTNFSFDDCDPFEAQAIVMDIFPNKGQFIAAEQIIYVVDMPIGDQRLITEITDATGRRLDLGSLRRGQWIHVKGFKHIAGGVVASWVQKIDPPEIKRPVLRKLINERPTQQKRISSATGVININKVDN